MKFPQDFIERVRESSNVVDVIGQFVQLRRSGSNHQGLCPFHSEKSPSFSVSEDKQVYHCFGCKASGNVFTFIQNFQGLTFPETIEYLARRAGLPLPELTSESGQAKKDDKQNLYAVNAFAARFYHEQLMRLPQDHVVRKYLEQRGLDEDVVRAYKLGYAPEAWSDLAEQLSARKAPLAVAEQVGLIKRRPSGKSGHYDLFRHRLMFPIFSPGGQCIGFGGRVFSKEQQPKYLNSPDSPVFHKGRVFYGLDQSAKFIRSEDETIVVEGYMDWLALAKVSIGNVVATLGTALTHDHAKVLKRYSQRVLVLFDGDEAGRAAARRSLPILLSEGLLVRGLFLPDQLDPDDFIKQRGDQALRQLIASAPDLFDLVSNEVWVAAKGSPSGKVQVLDELAPILAALPDPRLKRLYATNLANLLDVEPSLVGQSVARASSGAAGTRSNAVVASRKEAVTESVSPPTPSQPIKFDLSKIPRAELELLNVVLMKEVYLKEALKAEVGSQFAHPGARGVFQRISEVYGQMQSKFDSLSALLAGEVKPVEAVTRHLAEPYTSLPDEALNKLLQDCIKRVKENHLRSKSKELVSGLRGSDPTNSTQQLEQIMNVQRTRRSLNRES